MSFGIGSLQETYLFGVGRKLRCHQSRWGAKRHAYTPSLISRREWSGIPFEDVRQALEVRRCALTEHYNTYCVQARDRVPSSIVNYSTIQSPSSFSQKRLLLHCRLTRCSGTQRAIHKRSNLHFSTCQHCTYFERSTSSANHPLILDLQTQQPFQQEHCLDISTRGQITRSPIPRQSRE